MKQGGIWEFDCFPAPFPVSDADQPYYPMMVLWVQQPSGFVLHFTLTGSADYLAEVSGESLKLFERLGLLPDEMWVRREETRAIAESLAKALGFRVAVVKHLKGIENAVEGMRQMMGSRFAR